MTTQYMQDFRESVAAMPKSSWTQMIVDRIQSGDLIPVRCRTIEARDALRSTLHFSKCYSLIPLTQDPYMGAYAVPASASLPENVVKWSRCDMNCLVVRRPKEPTP